MNNLRVQAKDKIDKLFNRLEEVERQAKEAGSDPDGKWKAEIENLNKSKDTMETLYENLSSASEDSVEQLKKGFDEMAHVMDDKLNKIKKSFETEAK